MDNVIPLFPHIEIDNEESQIIEDHNADNLIELLEDALDMAEQGQLENIAICMICKDGTILTQSGTENKVVTLIGALETLKQDLTLL